MAQLSRAKKVIKWLGLGLFQLGTALLLVCLVLEWFPGLAEGTVLEKLPYYAMRSRFAADETLVFRTRPGYRLSLEDYAGDLYEPAYGPAPRRFSYKAEHNRLGFRFPEDLERADIAVLGDSYVAFGTDLGDTLSSRLAKASGRATLDLGRGWYGPPQYTEVLARYGLAYGPKVALLCFFEGNDLEDCAQYQKFRAGQGYYHFLPERDIVARLAALGGDLSRFQWSAPASSASPDDLVNIRLGTKDHSARFRYLAPSVPPLLLRASQSWRELERAMGRFGALCRANNIVPIVVFIPTKAHVYGPFTTSESGASWKKVKAVQSASRKNMVKAVAALCRDEGLSFWDLSPVFSRLAAEGEWLYYGFDSHWNEAGREAAAIHLAERLQERSINWTKK